MTLAQLRALCRKRLGDNTGAFWNDAAIDANINDACRDISFRTKSIRAEGYLTTVSCEQNTDAEGTSEWVLSSELPGIYSIDDVYFLQDGEDWEKLSPTNREDLDKRIPAWRTLKGITNTTTSTSTKTVTGATQADPCQLTIAGHGYSVDDEITITDVTGMTELNGNTYYINTVVDVNNVTLKDIDGVTIDSSGYTAYVSGGTSTLTTYTYTYNYQSNPATPMEYYWNREENVFGVYPPPNDDNAGTDYIHIYYTKRHTDISGDSSVPTIPEPLHQAVVNFVAAVGFEDRGWGDRANDQWEKYHQKLKDYEIERNREREDDEIIMKNYRNI